MSSKEFGHQIKGKSRSGWVFVLSTPRSGSTLLSVMLGANSAVVAPPELHAFRFSSYDTWKRDYSLSMKSLSALMASLGAEHSEQDLDRRFSGMETTNLYLNLHKLAGSERLLIDKTPSYGCLDESLARMEVLRPHYIWLIRHPLGVASSRHERKRVLLNSQRESMAWYEYHYQLLRRKVLDVSGIALRNEVNYWADVHARIARFLSAVDTRRVSTVHFESLVRSPRVVMQRLCDDLGLTLQPEMLDPTRNIPDSMQWGIGDEKIHSHVNIDPAVADIWRQRYGSSKLDRDVLRLMEKLGVQS